KIEPNSSRFSQARVKPRKYYHLGFWGGGRMSGQTRAFAPISRLAALRLIIFVALVFLQIPALHAQSSLYTDRFGNTTGTIGNDSVNMYRDRFGNTTGTIGNDSVNTYRDRFGNTTGAIGNNSVNTYSDRFGNTTGTVGNDSVN